MLKKGRILGLFVTIILIFVFTPLFLSLYEKIVGHQLYGGFGIFSGRSYLEGFFMSYAFFISIYASLFLEKKKYIFLSISLGLIFLLHIVFQVWESLIIFVATAITTFLLAGAIQKVFVKNNKHEKKIG